MVLLWRFLLLVVLALVVAALAPLIRQLGLGEYAVLLALFGILFVAESARFVIRQFLKGYRGRRAARR